MSAVASVVAGVRSMDDFGCTARLRRSGAAVGSDGANPTGPPIPDAASAKAPRRSDHCPDGTPAAVRAEASPGRCD